MMLLKIKMKEDKTEDELHEEKDIQLILKVGE